MSKEGGVFPDIDRPRHPDFNDKIEVKGKFISFPPYPETITEKDWMKIDAVVQVFERPGGSVVINGAHHVQTITTATIPQVLLALNSPHLFVK